MKEMLLYTHIGQDLGKKKEKKKEKQGLPGEGGRHEVEEGGDGHQCCCEGCAWAAATRQRSSSQTRTKHKKSKRWTSKD